MQIVEGKLVLSVSDLTGYLVCEHLTQLERSATESRIAKPQRDDPDLDILVRRGEEHEQNYLRRLREEGLTIVEFPDAIPSLNELFKVQRATLEAMRMGMDVIYQGTLFDGRWLGRPDIMKRVPVPDDPDAFAYEIEDTKLARRVKGAALLQICAYSDQLGHHQERTPSEAHLVLGDMSRRSFPLRDYSAYFRAIRDRFELAVFGERPETYPDPVVHCAICRWSAVCDERRRADDHLSLVAGMRREQVRKLKTVGIHSVEELAKSAVGQSVHGIGQATLERLQHQARLQVQQRQDGRVMYELLSPMADRGLALLPEPSPDDLFFDIEGDPFVGENGLEYLLGVVEVINDQPVFHDFWAHSALEEKRSFEAFIDFVIERLDRNPKLHVYHYAPYEKTAMRRLAGQHATREREVDRLLRGGVLVDLFQVVRQSLRVSTESYSLKKLEPMYMEKREGAITDAGSSIVAYEDWLQTGEQQILDDIGEYNRIDCESTLLLRDWLEGLRDEAAAQFGDPIGRPIQQEVDAPEAIAQMEDELQALYDRLMDNVAEVAEERDSEAHARWLLAHLLGWHRREAKTEWWSYFSRLGMSDEELEEDPDAIGGLSYEGIVGEEKRSCIHRYRFDANQQHKLAEGDTPVDPKTEKSAGTVVGLDSIEGILDLKRGKRGKSSKVPHPTALMPGQPVNTTVLRQAIARVAAYVADNGISGLGDYRAIRDLLLARSPQVEDHGGGALVQPDESLLPAMQRVVSHLGCSCLPVQGPPGTGKTYMGARTILHLVQAGFTIGITATSHKAISNLLLEVVNTCAKAGNQIRAIQKAPKTERHAGSSIAYIDKNGDIEAAIAARQVDVVAGTPWLFAREGMTNSVDYLFIDEAGQMSLANAVAIGTSARNIVLLGDPGQLAQPSQGIHPPGAGCSALEHLLGESATIPSDRGLFLSTSFRLHPDVCDFISEAFYEHRLESATDCAVQQISGGPILGGTGLRYWPAEHVGNRISSTEEADLIVEGIHALIGREWTGPKGVKARLTLDDILVVAPYNAQVSTLKSKLPKGARIGTVDKFQGQEAPVVFYSLATSTTDDIPRGMDFLFSLNRLNVALSRARCLAILVCSPRLLRIRCRSVREMRLANAMCRAVEVASAISC